MLAKNDPTHTLAWKKLKEHKTNLEGEHMRDWFASNPNRFEEFQLSFDDILFDFSKNRITQETLNLLKQLSQECQIKEAIESKFNGQIINETEGRSVLHTALRNFTDRPINVNGKDVMSDVRKVLKQMKAFCHELNSGSWKGYNGQAITDIVNIGIGGSDLGPAMIYEALKPYHSSQLNCHFVSNVDGADIAETLKNLNPNTTLFVIASKTFSTQETMTNASTAKDWLLKELKDHEAIAKHFVAVSTNKKAVEEFGINPKNTFEFWDWVGGRYSVWSSIGLTLACGIGFDNFEQLLKGAHKMDEHFRSEPFEKNIPLIMATIGIWYTNFWDASSEAIIPYYQNMHRFAAYFQQGNMESNGKNIDRKGKPVNYTTGPIIWGEPGTNGQHAFFQLLHQGTHLIPCDFIGFSNSPYTYGDHHKKLMANFFAQTEALMQGKTKEEVEQEMRINKNSTNEEKQKVPYRVFEGNRPTTTILASSPNPETLGKLIACYEHKIFAQGIIWNIFSFDQWGVELGKQLAKNILPKLEDPSNNSNHLDASTSGLIKKYHHHRES